MCVKSLPASRTNGELPGPFSRFLLGAAGKGKSLSAPSLPNPGEGRCIPEGQNSLNSQDKLTYTDTQSNNRPLPISLTLPSLERPRERGRQSRAAAGSPCCPAAPVLPHAQRLRSPPRLRSQERPGIRVHARCSTSCPHGDRRGSEGHDGCAPRVHVSQHRLIAADLPRLAGFRIAPLSLGFLRAAPGAFS